MAWPRGKSRKSASAVEQLTGMASNASPDLATQAQQVIDEFTAANQEAWQKPAETPQEPPNMPEQRLLQEVVSVPTASNPAGQMGMPRQPSLKTWLVSIPGNPEERIEAKDKDEAIAEYFRLRNIIKTVHQPTIKEVV